MVELDCWNRGSGLDRGMGKGTEAEQQLVNAQTQCHKQHSQNLFFGNSETKIDPQNLRGVKKFLWQSLFSKPLTLFGKCSIPNVQIHPRIRRVGTVVFMFI